MGSWLPIDPNVLFQRVSPCQIIVPVIGGSPNEASPHISFSLNRQEGNLKIYIGSHDPIDQHHLVGMFEAFSHELRQDLRRAFCPICLQNLPFTSRPTIYQRPNRSEEHTSELQSLAYLVCRLLLEKKKTETEYRTGEVVVCYLAMKMVTRQNSVP